MLKVRSTSSRPIAVLVLAALAVVAGCTSEPSGDIAKAQRAAANSSSMSLLFVQTAQGGSLQRDAAGDGYDLRLTGVSPTTSWFSDRPERKAGTQTTSTMIGDWAGFGFAADPPNAALVFTDRAKTEDTVIVELSEPRYDAGASELRYRARVLDAPRDGLVAAKGRAPAVLPSTFATSSLFIDDAEVGATTGTSNDLRATTSATRATTPSTTATSASAAGSTGPTSAACTSTLATFGAAATAGTYTSPAQTIAFTNPPKLKNPATPGSTSGSQTLSIPFVAYGANGETVTPSATAPVTVSIYGAPAGSVQTTPAGSGSAPIVLSVTSGSELTLTYDGAYLSRPISVVASMPLPTTNVCTGTADYALGSTSLALTTAPTALGTVSYSTPTTCTGGTSGSACATQNVDTVGLGLSATAGYGAAVPGATNTTATAPTKFANYTIDTGSIGTAVPWADLGPDAVGPGQPAYKYYDSSGNEFIGYVYLAPVTLQMGSQQVTTDPIRLLAVMSSACHPNKTCTAPPAFANFHYMGVGFDRSNATAADPFRSPSDNALLSIDPASGGMTPGYTLSGSTIEAGLTSANSTAPTPAALTPNTTYPGDWNAVPMCVSFPTAAESTPTPTCGAMLMDVGIGEMFITFAAKSDEPAVLANGLPANQTIAIAAPNATTPALSYNFSSGPAGGASPPATGLAPSAVDLGVLSGTNPVFINTGRHVLFGYEYIFNAQAGTVGFAPLSTPLR